MAISASELVKERADLLARIEEINAALGLLQAPGKAVEIRTSRNLRNTNLPVSVYTDETLTSAQSSAAHDGYITAEDAALLRSEYGDWIEDGVVSVYA